MTTNRKLPTVLCYDVEDIIAPEADDAALWLAEILHEHGLTGSFMVMGELVRLWERRGRRDVIEALKKHHLAYHSTWHSLVHPTTTEICLQRDFREGMDALWQWDGTAWTDSERILGRPLIGWARTGSSWSPSVQGLMGRMGRGYIYSVVQLPGHNVCWYANSLGFHGEGVGGFDEVLYDTALFDHQFARVEQQVDRLVTEMKPGANYLCGFIGHPTRVISTDFWDAVNFSKGANPPPSEWRQADRYAPEIIPTMQNNYRRLCAWLRDHPGLEIMGWGDLLQRFDGQRPAAADAELREIARRIVDEQQVLFTDFFTAGEILLMLCRAVIEPAESFVRPTVYGPLTTPPASSRTEWSGEAIRQAASSVLQATQYGYLPASVTVGEETLGIGSYFVGLAGAFLGQQTVKVPTDAPYPLAAETVAREAAETIPNWIIHPDNMDLANLLEQTRLQCWTLKPAWERDILFPAQEGNI